MTPKERFYPDLEKMNWPIYLADAEHAQHYNTCLCVCLAVSFARSGMCVDLAYLLLTF